MRLYLVFLLLLGHGVSCAQLWKNYRREFSVGLGAANCLTDLGGGKGDGGYIKDVNLIATRPALQGAFRYRISERLAFKTTLSYIMLEGNDANSKDPERKNRNLSFRTHVAELGLFLEYYIIKEPLGKLNVPDWQIRGNVKKDYSLYLFAGLAPYYFDPTAQSGGKWHRLRPLGTQGQGLPGGAPEYSAFSIAIPIGIGGKYIINRQWSIGVDFGMRFTFNDNLDDVSVREYYDRNVLQEEKGSLTAKLSDRRIEDRDLPGWRGGPDNNDVYFVGFVTLNYKLSQYERIRILFWRD